MLRAKTRHAVHRAIEESKYFKLADVSIVESDKGKNTLLRLEYLYDAQYFLAVTIPDSKEVKEDNSNPFGNRTYFVIRGTQAPGELSATEPVELFGLEQLTNGITEWLQRIRTELQTGPLTRQVDEQGRKLDELMVEMSALPEEYFSKEEAEQLQERLTDLEKRLTENLSQNVKDNKELSAKIESVRSDIQMLKDNVQNLTKPKLMRALLARTFDWLKDPVNRKLITSGAQVAKDILLESGHHSATSGQ